MGVRSNIFQPPRPGNIDEALSAAGFDVWNFDWRASIDQPPNEWTLDEAAAVILEHTGDAIAVDSLTMIDLPRWSRGRVVLLGDAAHCLTFVSGQGAGMAIASAEMLARH